MKESVYEWVERELSCGVQFHRSRARAARCPVTKHFFEPELDDE